MHTLVLLSMKMPPARMTHPKLLHQKYPKLRIAPEFDGKLIVNLKHSF